MGYIVRGIREGVLDTWIVASAVIMVGIFMSTAEPASPPRTQLHRIPAQPKAAPQGLAAFKPFAPSPIETPYHYQDTLTCSDCHSMHYSQQHDFEGAPGQGFPALAGGPTAKLLRKGSALDLCLACHDGMSGTPDVVDADVNGLQGRAAGFFGQPDTPHYKGHNLARNLTADPNDLCNRCHFGGTMATAAVLCTDCHNPHGNGRYRNLQWASWPGGEPMIKAFISPGATSLARYEVDNVRYPAPADGDSSYREVTNICIDCHHAFMDDSGSSYTKPGGMTHWGRHAGTNSEWGAYRPINAQGANTDPAHWVSGTGAGFTVGGSNVPRVKFIVSGAVDFAAAGVVAANNEVFCLSCHQAHGTSNAFALRWNYGSTAQDGTSQAGCQQCHNR